MHVVDPWSILACDNHFPKIIENLYVVLHIFGGFFRPVGDAGKHSFR